MGLKPKAEVAEALQVYEDGLHTRGETICRLVGFMRFGPDEVWSLIPAPWKPDVMAMIRSCSEDETICILLQGSRMRDMERGVKAAHRWLRESNA